MKYDILSMLFDLKINELFELMNTLICREIDEINILQSVNMTQKLFDEHIAKSIRLAHSSSRYQRAETFLEDVKHTTCENFELLRILVLACIEHNPDVAANHFSTFIQSMIQDIFLETMSGEVPVSLIKDGRYKQITKNAFSRCFYRVRAAEGEDCKKLPPGEIFHIPYSLQQHANRGRYSLADYPSLYLATDIDLALKECGNPQRYYISEFQSNYLGYEFSEFNDPLDIVLLALYHPYDIWLRMSNASEITHVSPDYWYKLLKRYLNIFPLTYSCSMKSSGISHAERKIEYVIPQLLMQWIVHNKQFCDGVLYFPKAIEIKYAADIYKYNLALPALPPFDKAGYSEDLKKRFRWSPPTLKPEDSNELDNKISSLSILTGYNEEEEFIYLCAWLNEHHILYSVSFDESISGVKIVLRQWEEIIDIENPNCIKFVLNRFNPDELVTQLQLYGVNYFLADS